MKAAIAALVLCLATAAAAHPLDTGYLRVDAQGDRFTISFDIDVVVAGDLLQTEPGAIDPVLVTRATELADRSYRTAAPVAGGNACTWGTASATRKGQTVSITESATCPPGDVTWDLSFVKQLASTFQILGRVSAHGVDHVITVDKNKPVIEFAGGMGASTLGSELWRGISHAGLSPDEWRGPRLPDGLDHLLLVLALLLGGGTLLRSCAILGAFAAAHTLALGVAFLGASLPSEPFEAAFPLVTLVITCAAIAGRYENRRWIAAAVAGGLHGFAIAGDLAPSANALIGFSFGLGLAQIAVVFLIGPLAAFVLRYEDAKRYCVPAAGALIILLSLEAFLSWIGFL